MQIFRRSKVLQSELGRVPVWETWHGNKRTLVFQGSDGAFRRVKTLFVNMESIGSLLYEKRMFFIERNGTNTLMVARPGKGDLLLPSDFFHASKQLLVVNLLS